MTVNPIVSKVDPITFEILSHRLYQIAKEMGTTLERVGGTVNTTQMHDYMASLYLANGDVLSPGGNSPGATEICQEGIRIPGIKLVDRGELRKDFFDAFINMTRQPVMVGL